MRLENLLWPQGSKPQVTLIDQSARFVFKPLLYELLNGGASAEEVAPFFTKLLAPYSTNFIQVVIPTHALLLLPGLRKQKTACGLMPDTFSRGIDRCGGAMQGSVQAVEEEEEGKSVTALSSGKASVMRL